MASEAGDMPELFAGAREYLDDHGALEDAQATFNEEELYCAMERLARDWFAAQARPARILDLCCATGLTALRVARATRTESVTLVDTDRQALERARVRLVPVSPSIEYCEDAAHFRAGGPYDLILMNSAYHHIEDGRKTAFLENARRLLGAEGAILLGEHFLPEYHDNASFKRAVVEFYTRLLAALEQRGEPRAALDVIRRSAKYCWEGQYEYKTSWLIFERHVAAAGLRIVSKQLIWSDWQQCTSDVGTWAVQLAPAPLHGSSGERE